MKKIIWLASYPKSGNTWFRIFLTNLIQESEKPVSINFLANTPIASSRNLIDEAIGIDSSDLTHDEIDLLRPEVYNEISKNSKKNIFMKIHDAFTSLPNGKLIFPSTAAYGAIYFIRNPLDVAISYANHSGITIDKAINQMNSDSFCFCGKTNTVQNQLKQKLLSWSGHVKSWVETKEIPVHIMKYEDMKKDPLTTFSKAVKFANLDKTKNQIEKALKFSEFSLIKKQESESGFKERSPKCKSFFSKGESGYWKSVLNEKQINKIIDKHGKVMKRFGY